jgi:signal transduction histidine kinase
VSPRTPRPLVLRSLAALALLLAAFAVSAAILGALRQRAIEEVRDAERQSLSRWLDTTLVGVSDRLRLFVASYARRTTFTRPEQENRGMTPEASLSTGVRTYEIDAAWVLEADGAVRLRARGEGSRLTSPPVKVTDLVNTGDRRVRFYVEQAGLLHEVSASRLAGSGPTASRGWLVAIVALQEEELLASSGVVGATLTLVAPDAPPRPPHAHTIVVERPLRDLAGTVVRIARLEANPLSIRVMEDSHRHDLLVMGGFVALALALLSLLLWRWLIVPVRRLREALARQDPALLQPLRAQGDELGALARSTTASIVSQQQLERSCADRARLGRDLQQGPVRTLTDAGLGLSTAGELLVRDPATARRIVADTRTRLGLCTETLRDLIARLEPEELRQQSFAQALQTIVDQLRAVHPVPISLEVDAALASRLPSLARMQLVQIVREVIGAAIRQGDLHRASIVWRAEPEGAVLFLAHDGRIPARAIGPGGEDFGTRARELGGTATIGTDPAGGTTLRVVLPGLA